MPADVRLDATLLRSWGIENNGVYSVLDGAVVTVSEDAVELHTFQGELLWWQPVANVEPRTVRRFVELAVDGGFYATANRFAPVIEADRAARGPGGVNQRRQISRLLAGIAAR